LEARKSRHRNRAYRNPPLIRVLFVTFGLPDASCTRNDRLIVRKSTFEARKVSPDFIASLEARAIGKGTFQSSKVTSDVDKPIGDEGVRRQFPEYANRIKASIPTELLLEGVTDFELSHNLVTDILDRGHYF
jgi:hypothetical protein